MSDPRAALERFIRRVMQGTLYHGTFACTVHGQNDDDSLELLPDDERVRGNGLSNVPIRHGVPGVRVRVVVGSRVLLGFENGDPRRPYAALWEPGSIESIRFDGGNKPIARKGDPVAVYWPAKCTVAGTLGGVPFVSDPMGVTLNGPTVGIIDDGNPKVLG